MVSYRIKTPKRSEPCVPTSKKRFNHQTWKMPSPTSTPIWKMLHHLTLPFVLSAVFLWVRSRITMYDCSSLTWAKSSDNSRTGPLLAACLSKHRMNLHTLSFQWVRWSVSLWHVDDTMDVERDFLA
jgi:hypothetical protein